MEKPNDSSRLSGGDKAKPPEHDFVIVLKLKQGERDHDVIADLLGRLKRKGIDYFLHAEPHKLYVMVRATDSALHRQLFKARLNDWLNGVGRMDFDHIHELDPSRVKTLSQADRLRLFYYLLTGSKADEGGGGGGLELLGPSQPWADLVEDLFCRHDIGFNKRWISKWSKKWYLTLDDFTLIRDHFGERISLYFAFLQNYFTWLLAPALWSLLAHFSGFIHAPSYTVAVMLWGLVFVEQWARREQDLAMFWGSSNCYKYQKVRHGFVQDRIVRDEVTGRKKKFYSPYKRTLKSFVAFVVISLMMMVLLSFIFILFSVRLILSEYYTGPFHEYAVFAPTIAYSLFIPKLTGMYAGVCRRLNSFENHATEWADESHLAQKLFVSSFVLNFASPLLYGLYYVPFGHHLTSLVGHFVTIKPHDVSEDLFKGEITYFIMTGQVINLATELIVPFVSRHILERISQFRTSRAQLKTPLTQNASSSSLAGHGKDSWVRHMKREAALPEYDVTDDYSEIVLQFGYVMVFSSVYPLCALASFLNNWVELRSDAIKICINAKRPIPQRTDTIGNWLMNLRFFLWLSVFTNVAWMFMFDERGKSRVNGPEGNWWILLRDVVIWEHAFMVTAYVIAKAVKELPSWAQIESRKIDWALKRKYLTMVGEDEELDDEEEDEAALSAASIPGVRRKMSVEDLAEMERSKIQARVDLDAALKLG
eukprot:Partr_v1_DN27928_c1_g1_i3_m11259 putative Anoctamin